MYYLLDLNNQLIKVQLNKQFTLYFIDYFMYIYITLYLNFKNSMSSINFYFYNIPIQQNIPTVDKTASK